MFKQHESIIDWAYNVYAVPGIQSGRHEDTNISFNELFINCTKTERACTCESRGSKQGTGSRGHRLYFSTMDRAHAVNAEQKEVNSVEFAHSHKVNCFIVGYLKID